MAGLAPAATEDAFTAICRDEAALRPGVERLGRDLGVDVSRLTGSRPVYAAGDLVLKLFPPVAAWPGYRVEAEVLAAVRGKLPIPTPRVHAAGDHDGWGCVLMSRLPGVRLDTVWDQLSAGDRDRLAGQRARCVNEQRGLGLPALWADQVPGFLDEVALPSRPPVLLHTEVMRQHLLVRHRMTDREPSRLGWRSARAVPFPS
jgi:hygromycin-B 7''-O-kinase